MRLVHQADHKSHSWKENLQTCSRLRPFQSTWYHLESALFLVQQLAFVGEIGSKHAFLLLWGYFAQAISVKTLLSSPQKKEVAIPSLALGNQTTMYGPTGTRVGTHTVLQSELLCSRLIVRLLKTVHSSLVFKSCTKGLHNYSGGRVTLQTHERKGWA